MHTGPLQNWGFFCHTFFDFLTKLLKISEPIGIVLQGSSSCVRTCGDLRMTLIGGPKVSEMLDFVGFLGV